MKGWWLGAVLILAGCATGTAPSVTQRVAQPDASFALNGRVAIRHEDRQSSAALRWEHRDEVDDILLMGPLGKTVAHIHRDGQQIVLDTQDRHETAADAEALTHRLLGWELPLSGLRYWIQGVAAPTPEPQMEFNEYGQLSELRQSGWVIRYARFASTDKNALPLRLSLRREHLELLLLIDEWEKQ